MPDAVIRTRDPHKTDQLHWMPFGISHDGACNAADYFQPSEDECCNATAHYSAHFRGRRLKGQQKQLPEGYQGLILKPCGAPQSTTAADTEQRSWQACQSFQHITVWNHDTVPVPTDWHMRCIDWLALADKVHAPVDVSQVEQELRQLQQEK